MKVRRLLLPCLWVLLLGIPANLRGQSEDDIRRAVIKVGALPRVFDPTLESTVTTKPEFKLQGVTEGDTTGTARMIWSVKEKWLLDLGVSGPLDKSTKEARLASLDGLSGSTTISLGFSRILFKPTDSTGGLFQIEHFDTMQLQEAAGHVIEGTLDQLTATERKQLASYAAKVLENKPVWFFTLAAKTGPEDFEFLDPGTLEERKQSETNTAISASIGAFVKDRFFLSLAYRDERTHTASEESELCVPLGQAGALNCTAEILGGPTRTDAEVAQLGLRRLFKRNHVGFGFRASRDFENSVTGIEVPLYFLQKPPDPEEQLRADESQVELTGGISLGWRSDTDDFSIVLFVGPALKAAFDLGG